MFPGWGPGIGDTSSGATAQPNALRLNLNSDAVSRPSEKECTCYSTMFWCHQTYIHIFIYWCIYSYIVFTHVKIYTFTLSRWQDEEKGPSASHDWRLLVLAVQDQCRWLRQYVDSSPRTLERLARGSEIYPPWHGQSWLCRWAPGCAAQKAGFAGIGAALSQAWAHWNIPGFSVQGHLGRWLPNQTGVHLPEVLPGARRGPQGRHEFSFAPGSGKYRRACATCIGFTCNRCLFVCLLKCLCLLFELCRFF